MEASPPRPFAYLSTGPTRHQIRREPDDAHDGDADARVRIAVAQGPKSIEHAVCLLNLMLHVPARGHSAERGRHGRSSEGRSRRSGRADNVLVASSKSDQGREADGRMPILRVGRKLPGESAAGES